MKKASYLIIYLSLSFLGVSCATQSVNVERAPAVETKRVVEYDNFGEATNNLDFYAAKKLAASESDNVLAEGLSALADNRIGAAKDYIYRVYNNNEEDDYRSLLLAYYKFHNRWNNFVELAKEIGSGEGNVSAASKWAAEPRKTIEILGGKTTVPCRFSIAGTPELSVNINGIEKEFLLDPGVPHTVISTDAVIETSGKIYGTSCNMLDKDMSLNKGQSAGILSVVKIGDMTLTNLPVVIADVKKNARGVQVGRYDGILGWDFLQTLCTKIDWENKLVSFSYSPGIQAQEKTLFAVTGPFVVFKTLGGQTLHLSLDFGAQESELYASAFYKITGENVFKIKPPTKDFIMNMNNIVLTAGNKYFTFNRISVYNRSVMKGFVNMDGITGTGMFGRGALTINYKSGSFAYESDRYSE